MGKYNIGDKIRINVGKTIFGRQRYVLGHILMVQHRKVMCNLGGGYGVWWISKKNVEVLEL